ncbi:MAG: Crp/Fnr family transcriptional regulator [Alphaproteobacteria bacterium]|uniref:Crp/Fnr family transcriptional regulator n=1 Tax=Candidatus Nitrobium versatile TaxID=2884831 RepID=A0A953LXF9_9BACT|nr:Crp/Fnr family transcriptional regulator [Candidatus Nitrobium versatile]
MGFLCDESARKTAALSPLCIGSLWVFEHLRPEEVKAIIGIAQPRQYKKRQIIFTQGDPASEMFLVRYGRVKMSRLSSEGNELTLDIMKSGDFVGEQALEESFTYPFTATSIEETLAFSFSKGAFEELILEYPNIGLQLIKKLTRRINWLASRAEIMTSSTLEDRLLKVLSTVALEHGEQSSHGIVIQFPLTHEELSFLVGAHRVSVTKAMKNLKESGKLVQQGKKLSLS